MAKLNVKSGILLGALFVGSGAAVAQVVFNAQDDEPRYNWSAEGQPNLPNATVQQAMEHFGCSAGSQQCAYGESLDPNVEDEILTKAP